MGMRFFNLAPFQINSILTRSFFGLSSHFWHLPKPLPGQGRVHSRRAAPPNHRPALRII
jgi:hypothetical protein